MATLPRTTFIQNCGCNVATPFVIGGLIMLGFVTGLVRPGPRSRRTP